jgi:hypothetical protein
MKAWSVVDISTSSSAARSANFARYIGCGIARPALDHVDGHDAHRWAYRHDDEMLLPFFQRRLDKRSRRSDGTIEGA